MRPSRRRGYSTAIGSFTFSTSSLLSQTSSTETILRADARVRIVGEGAADAGTLLDRHLVAVVDQLERARGRERDAVLVRLDLLGDADPHGGGSLPAQQDRRDG